jgi:GNAT superfamily N-acetyltransferase
VAPRDSARVKVTIKIGHPVGGWCYSDQRSDQYETVMPRYALMEDVPQVAAIYHSVWHETQAPFMPPEECKLRKPQFFEKRMSALFATTLVAERAGSIVGFASWQDHLLGQIYVSTAHRGSGLASELITASEIEMARPGTKVAELHCIVGNNRARRFYERMSWQHGGEILKKVSGSHGLVGVAFWRMTKQLVV